MAYSETKQYTLDAATTAFSDIIAALITHFTAAPGLWQLTPSVSPVAGQSLSIRAKVDSTCDIAIRRESTSTSINVLLDPGKSITLGNSTTATTGSATASPECKTLTITGISTRFFVIEYPDAINIVFQDSTKFWTPYAIHAGVIYEPFRPNWPALGIDGHGVLVGSPSATGTNCWSNTGSQTNGSRLRVMDDGGGVNWVQAQSADLGTALGGSTSLASTSPDGSVKLVVPIGITGSNINSTGDLNVGMMKYVGAAPAGSSPSFPSLSPRSFIEASTDEAWVYIDISNSTTGLVFNTEKGAAFT